MASSAGKLHICVMSRAVIQHHIGGGMELLAEIMRRGLVERGHRVTTITTPHPEGLEQVTDEWGETLFVGSGAPIQYSRDWWEASQAALLALHRERPIDVLAGHGKACYHYLGARRRLPAADQVPVVVITHNTIIGDARAQMAQIRRHPVAVARWAPHGVGYFLDDRRRMPLADAVTALTEDHADALRRWFGLPHDRVTVIPNGVDLPTVQAGAARRREFRERFGIHDTTRMILVIARLMPDKGQHYLLDALARPEMQPFHDAVRLVFVGDGPSRSALEAQARALDLQDRVTFAGRLPHEDVPGMLAAADIVAHPSTAEGMSISLLEAMASGRPIVASNIPAIASVLADGVTGRLFTVGHPAALARALVATLQAPEQAAEMGARAHAAVVAQYDQQATVDSYEHVFLRTAGTAQAAHPVES